MRFAGKTAVVTGAASGIGKATSLRLASEGALVFAADIDEAGGRELAETSNGKIRFQRTDVTVDTDIEALMAAAAATGRLDIVFNNAGAGGDLAPIDEIDAAGWDRTMALMLRSVAMGIRHASTRMKPAKTGAIVNTASVASFQSGMATTAYSVAKAGVLHLTTMAAADLAQHGIRVNAVCPGFITTNIFTSALDITGDNKVTANTMIEQLAGASQPIARPGRPEDIAGAVAFLASEDASFITGTHILVDGGLLVGPRHSWDPNAGGIFDAMKAFVS